jgi:hypothetical protein
MIQKIETAILERLKAKLPKQLLIDGFPDDAKAYERLPWDRGVILVAYRSSDFGEPKPMGLIAQDRTFTFEVQVRTKNLRTLQGAYAYLDAVRAALTGYRPLSADQLIPVSERFIEADDFVWTYALLFKCTAPYMEIPDAITEAPMIRLSFKNQTFDETLEVSK